MASITRFCQSCSDKQLKHEYQDKQYGKYIRLHNECTKGARCTICGNKTN